MCLCLRPLGYRNVADVTDVTCPLGEFYGTCTLRFKPRGDSVRGVSIVFALIKSAFHFHWLPVFHGRVEFMRGSERGQAITARPSSTDCPERQERGHCRPRRIVMMSYLLSDTHL